MGGNITKNEKILLLCTLAFLLGLFCVCWRDISAADGQRWVVETEHAVSPDAWISPDAGRINLNTASPELLAELPGIGEALAARIVEYREKNGPFRASDEIMKVKGIGETTYRAIADLITVEDAER